MKILPSTHGNIHLRPPPATLTVFTMVRMMYETEAASQQPINQPQNKNGHFGPKPYWLMTNAVWSDGGSENTIVTSLFVSVQTSLMLTNGYSVAVRNAPRGSV